MTAILIWLQMDKSSISAAPASFEAGEEVTVISKTIGPSGGSVPAGNTGTPIDGAVVEFPTGAFLREHKVTVSYNTGRLSNVRGIPSAVFLRIGVAGVQEFDQPVKITVHYDARKWKGHILVGYAIDEKGRLSVIDSGPLDQTAGVATFFTGVPLLFTWVYVQA